MSLLHIAGGATEDKLDSSDVFSTYLYTGNGATQTIVNGIDLVGKGGMEWIKDRDGVGGHFLTDTVRGLGKQLSTHTVGQENYEATAINAWNSNGFSIGAKTDVNTNGRLYSSWAFREAPKFFHQVLKVHSQGTASTVDLSILGTVGMVTVKSTINTGNWFTWHKDLTTGNNLKLNLTDAQSTTNAYLSVSGTTLTIASTAPSDTYIVYAWAHDTSADGIIQCGSYVGTSAVVDVNLGWEAQYVMVRRYDGTENWSIYDTMRGMVAIGSADNRIMANSSSAEDTVSGINPTATGFSINTNFNQSGFNFIYMAIRRPNKVPTSGTQVFATSIGAATSPAFTFSNVVADCVVYQSRIGNSGRFSSRLTGATSLNSGSTNAEYSDSFVNWDNSIFTHYLSTRDSHIGYAFKRAKGFFDIVCYTGNGINQRPVSHNLGVVPELVIVKSRSVSGNFGVYHSSYGYTKATWLNMTNAATLDSYNMTLAPTDINFYVSDGNPNNYPSATYVAYLFATLANVSKCFSYTGNGTSLNVECGFSTGARFVLCKRTDSTGDWFVFDSIRGITAANDPHLSLNTTAAEVTADDSIDPYANGFTVNQNATTNLNVNGGTYIGLAIA